MSLPTLRLVERRRRRCRLAPDEVRFLLEHHCAHLDLTPTPCRNVWQVTPTGVAGVILTPLRRVVISPKLPLRNVLFLLDPHSEPDDVNTSPSDGEAVIELLVGLL